MPRSKQEAKKRKKRRAHFLKDAPFPVPIQSTVSEPMAKGAWFYYTGYIEGSTVVIKHTGDIDFLHKMGFFGKGILSRSEPSFHERKQKVNVRVRKVVAGATEPKPTLIRATVTSKRNYLAHKKYKALRYGNGTEYNYIIHCEEQQKLGLEGLSDEDKEDDEDEEEEEEEEDDDEEGDSDDGGPRVNLDGGDSSKMLEAFLMLSGGSVQARLGIGDAGSSMPHRKLSFRDASKETRMSVVALLSELAVMSREKIATFAKVPHTLPQLREKYGLLRRAEIALVQQRQNQVERFSKHGEVIDVDDVDDDKGGGGDSVVVLDSDEEDSDGEEEETNAEGAKKKSVETTKKATKGWGDYDDGDEDGWGSTDDTTQKAEDVPNFKNGTATDAKEDSVGTSLTDKLPETKQSENSTVESKNECVADDKMEVDNASNTDSQEKREESISKQEEVNKTRIKDANMPDQKTNEEGNDGEDHRLSNGDSSVKRTDSTDKNSVIEDQGSLKEVSDSANKVVSETNFSKKLIGNNEPPKSVKEIDTDNEDKDVNTQETQDKGDKHVKETSLNGEGIVGSDVEGQRSEAIAATGTGSLSVDVPDKNGEEKSERANLTVTADLDHDKPDEDASNDSDDVICIEAESATPSSVRNLLSQPRSTVVTKSVTFMSNITSEPTYVNAKVGFNSWDSLVHFNYSGDPTHLPTVMSTSSSREEETIASDTVNQIYERLFPPVTTLLPGYKSEGAVIKQRLKGLPCLTPAYFKLSKVGTSTSSSSTLLSSLMSNDARGNSKRSSQSAARLHSQRQQKSKFHQSTPHSSHTWAGKQKATFSNTVSPIASVGSRHWTSDIKDMEESSNEHSTILVESSLDSTRTPAQTSQPKLYFHPAVVKKYLKIFDEPDSEMKNSNDNDTDKPPLSSVSRSLQQLKEMYTQDNSSLPDSPQTTSLLSQFHSHLSQYLPHAGVLPEKESDILKSLLSTKDTSPACLVDKETLDLAKKLTHFQIKILEERLNHLKKIVGADHALVESSSDAGNPQNKRKTPETSENPIPKRHRSDSPETNSRLKDMCGDSDSNSGAFGLENDNNSCAVQDPTNITMDTSKLNNSEIPSNSEDFKTSLDQKLEKSKSDRGTTSEHSKEDALITSGSSKENGSCEQIYVEDSTMEETSKTKSKNMESVSVDSTHGKAKSVGKKKQGDLNDSSVDRISIGSSSEEDDDESDSNSDSSEDLPSASTLDARSLCKTDDPDGDLFVINNTSEEEELDDNEDEGQAQAMRNAHRWKPCVKEDPHPVQERLQLMLEEAFFLSYGLGCLRIIDPELKVLDLKQTWGQFQVLKEQFVPHYVAYHYFRSKGWVPKSGLKFGCDFILYREGPPFYHGSYSVVVQCVQEGSLLPCTRREGYPLDHRHLNWISLAGLNRITEHVAKELMFCYVIWPKGLGRQHLSSPECIRKFKVKEVLVSRWISSQERENKTEEDMP